MCVRKFGNGYRHLTMAEALSREVSTYLSSSSPELRFGLLPERIRSIVGSEAEWVRALRVHSISIQAGWSAPLGGDEPSYLQDVLTISRERGLLYPYHLADAIAAASKPSVRLDSPFEYYVEMIIERMRTERSYDTIPSFAAADCVRLVQCGRNEFIHALNACRSKGWLWKRRRNLIARQLPAAPPPDLPIIHWWEVQTTRAAAGALAAASGGRGRTASMSRPAAMRARAGSVLASLGDRIAAERSGASTPPPPPPPEDGDGEADDAAAGTGGGPAGSGGQLSAVEIETLGQLVMAASEGEIVLAGMLPREAVSSLHSAGLVRFGVPVSADDRISVPPLTGFVMNRVGNDYLEKLLYEIFVSNDESTPLGNLAALLDQPAELVTRAASIACRLGFAKKLTAPMLTTPPPNVQWNSSWTETPTDAAVADISDADRTEGLGGGAGDSPTSLTMQRLPSDLGGGVRRVALLVDSKMAACLMMSNLADELKLHAVTLYEVGKIPHEALDAFVGALSGVERPQIDEADVLEYFDQAIALCSAITFLRSHPACELDGRVRPLDVVRTESLATLDPSTRDRVLQRSYALLISMAPMVPSSEHIFTPSLDVHHFGPIFPLLTSPWLPLVLSEAVGRGPVSVVLPRGARLRALPRALRGCTHVLLVPWKGESLVVGVGSLLSVASELLLRSALLLQEHVADVAKHTASVALPLADDELAAATEAIGAPAAAEDSAEIEISVELDLSNATGEASPPARPEKKVSAATAGAKMIADEDSARAEALALQRALGLGASIGVVQLVRLPRAKEARWLPMGVDFGLPLSDAPTCEAACAAIAARRLFASESLAQHAASLGSLVERVQRCVSAAQFNSPEGEEEADSDDEAMLEEEEAAVDEASPPRPLLFDGTRLQQLREVLDLY